eukprot:scaffold75425_cov33-Phaeocystis_antarctica.AAC.1
MSSSSPRSQASRSACSAGTSWEQARYLVITPPRGSTHATLSPEPTPTLTPTLTLNPTPNP